MDPIYATVQQALQTTCRIDPADLRPDSNFFADLGIESVDFLDAVYQLDLQFGIKIPVGRWMGEINEGRPLAGSPFVMENFVRQITALIATKRDKSQS